MVVANPGGRWSMRPRTLLILMGVLLVGAAIVAFFLLYPRGGVDLVGFSRESTATVSFAGSFPAADQPKLMNPLGIAVRGTVVYVAESDAGRVRVFGLRGQDEGSIVVPVAPGAPTAYPSDVATLGADRIVVVDNSGERVLILDADPKAKSPVVTVVGEGTGPNSVRKPTAIAVDGQTIYVADGGDLAVKAYNVDGSYARTVVKETSQTAAFAGGLLARNGLLYASDSNAGRIVSFDRATGAEKDVFPDAYALPRGIASGLDGGLLVVDTFERAVRLVSLQGVRLDTIDGSVDGDGALSSPRGVAWVNSSKRAYVTDAQLGRVIVFNMRVLD